MKTCFILNPHSGKNRKRPGFHGLIQEIIKERSLDADLFTTEGVGHATELAREAVRRECECVVAVGGDGTMNEVAQALIKTPTALALMPCGSGNGLALHLGLPRSLSGVLELIEGRRSRTAILDTGSANGFPFFNAMGLGLDADVSRRFNLLHKRGLPSYLKVAVSAIFGVRPETVTITSGSQRQTLEVILVAVTNSDQYGNNARIAPFARVDDGILDLVAIRPVGFFRAVELGGRLFSGTLDRSPCVDRTSGTQFIIERSAPGIIHTDGETHATSATISISILPRSLRVLIPEASRAVRVEAGSINAGLPVGVR